MSEVEVNAPRIVDSSATARPATDSIRPDDDIRGRAGVAPIKAEYVIAKPALADDYDADDVAEGSTSHADGRDSKRRKTGGEGDSRDKKKNRGQNKNRGVPQTRDNGPKICRQWELSGTCSKDHCRFTHDWTEYFSAKPQDLARSGAFSDVEPYVAYLDPEIGGTDDVGRSIDLKTVCPVYVDLGYCPFGWRCRFLGGHVRKAGSQLEGEAEVRNQVGEWEIVGLGFGSEKEGWKNGETNWPEMDTIGALRRATYDYPFTRRYLAHAEPQKPFTLVRAPKSGGKYAKYSAPPAVAQQPAPSLAQQPDITSGDAMYDEEAAMNLASAGADAEEEAMANGSTGNGHVAGEAEAMDVPLRPEEKRRLNWENGLYLAPLTTVGNLPFRRLCTDLGATITISEMALAQPLISGQENEWALCRRHSSEKNFGIQLAGSYPNRMVPAAELIAREIGASDKSGRGVDFVDVNLGCPIDLVFNQGAGSALLDMPGRLGKILVGMNRALGEIPLTVKFRTGVATGKPNAHKLVPRYATEWGASALTLHGRSRQQRYSKLADWEYIKQCTTTLRESLSDAGLPPVPMFGNGDCFSSQQYYEEKEKSGVDGVMIARGALIKPWIFTEVAERREWDISATERLEIVKKYAEYGLTHWGSDHLGLQKTRRFLCEFLSFTHRYIPIGLLERMPPMMNERPPKYRGRSELETLLASDDSRDWVKISEMFLGKTDESWGWVPKHKSNAYGGEEAQG